MGDNKDLKGFNIDQGYRKGYTGPPEYYNWGSTGYTGPHTPSNSWGDIQENSAGTGCFTMLAVTLACFVLFVLCSRI